MIVRSTDEEPMMATLNTEPHLASPDDFYDDLIALHRDLSEDESALVNAKLILLLANHIGDPAVLRAAMAAAHGDAMSQGAPE
jgi:hypothetical protein